MWCHPIRKISHHREQSWTCGFWFVSLFALMHQSLCGHVWAVTQLSSSSTVKISCHYWSSIIPVSFPFGYVVLMSKIALTLKLYQIMDEGLYFTFALVHMVDWKRAQQWDEELLKHLSIPTDTPLNQLKAVVQPWTLVALCNIVKTQDSRYFIFFMKQMLQWRGRASLR